MARSRQPVRSDPDANAGADADGFYIAGAVDLFGSRLPVMHNLHPSISAVDGQVLLCSRHRIAFSQTPSSKMEFQSRFSYLKDILK